MMVDDRGQAVGLMSIGLLCRPDLYTVSFGIFGTGAGPA
jgi:hypothetical protein